MDLTTKLTKYRKLGVQDALDLRAAYVEGQSPQSLAVRFNVSVSTVYRIIQGNWSPKPAGRPAGQHDARHLCLNCDTPITLDPETRFGTCTSCGAMNTFLVDHFGANVARDSQTLNCDAHS